MSCQLWIIFQVYGAFFKYLAIVKVNNRACRFYLCLHGKAPMSALQAEIGWMIPIYIYTCVYNSIFLNMFNGNMYNKMDVNKRTYTNLIWYDKAKKLKVGLMTSETYVK